MIIPYRNNELKFLDTVFTITDGSKGRYLMSEFLVDDDKLSKRISDNEILVKIREMILKQTQFDMLEGRRIVPNATQWFGGSVFSLDLTEQGFFLCVLRDMDKNNNGKSFPSDKIGGLLIPAMNDLTEEGKKLMSNYNPITQGIPVEDEKIKNRGLKK